MQAWYGKGCVVSIVAALLSLLMLTLAGCSPRFDWREIPNPEAGYVALFPARPAKVTRSIEFGAEHVELTLQAAVVGDISFAVGHARLPTSAAPSAAINASAWIARFEAALLQNLDAQINTQISTQVSAQINAQTPAIHPPKAPALRDISATGILRARREDAHGVPATLRARFYVQNGQLYEVMVIAPSADWNDEAVETFLAGFQLPPKKAPG